ncbi:MAG: polysaccharide biosynthesis/export family protein [Candidatus Acidiferrum sp.]
MNSFVRITRCLLAVTLGIRLLCPVQPLLAQDKSSPTPNQLAPEIQIGPGDLIEVKVLDIPELSQTVRVDDAGDATFLLIGRLHLAGLTAQQSQGLIASHYVAGDFLVSPQILVFIHEYVTQGVAIFGEVAKPGVYQVLGKRSLLELLSEAGGTTPTAANEVRIERSNDGAISTVKLSRDPDISLANDVELHPGDKVVVPRAGIVYVLGDVYRPGGFVMQNDGKLTVLEAVAMASGTQSTAALNGAKLIRKLPTGYVELPIALKKIMHGKEGDQQMQAEDILFVPASAGKAIVYRGLPGVLSAASSAAIYGAGF